MSELLDFLEKVNNQKAIVEKAKEALTKKQNILNTLLLSCTHNHGTYVKQFYVEGTYNDKAYTDVCTHCSVCGKLLSTETRQHSWYG